MRIVLEATALQTGPNARRAGVVRTVECLLEAITRGYPEHDYTVIVRPEHDVNEVLGHMSSGRVVKSWDKTRLWKWIGRDLEPLLKGADLYMSLTGPVPRLPWVPRSTVVHDTFSLQYPEMYTKEDKQIHDAMFRQVTQFAEVLFCNSEYTAQCFRDLVGRTGPIIPLPFGPPQPFADSAPEGWQAYRAEKVPFQRYVLALSTLEPRKNLLRLLEAWDMFCKAHPVGTPNGDLGLVVAGGKGWLFDQILEKVEGMQSKDRVALTGYVPDEYVPPLFREAELFVLPSITEGFGLPVLEALSIGVPVVCSNGGAVPEVGGDVPVYFDPTSAGAIVTGIETGLARMGERESWIQAGKARAARFDWDKCAEQMMETMLPLARR